MAFSFPQGFQMAHTEPVDNRLVLSKAEMLNMIKAKMPTVYLCICSDDGLLYLYNKNNSDDPETGKFRVFTGAEDIDLSEYATQNYVDNKFSTLTYAELNPITDYLYEIYYTDLDEKFAREHMELAIPEEPGACSSFRKGNWYGRNFDWLYGEEATFVVHIPHIGSKYSILGVSGAIPELTKEVIDNGTGGDLMKLIPFSILDGINEKGLVMNTNVVPNEKSVENISTPLLNETDRISAWMLNNYMLSRCATVNEVVDLLRNHVSVFIPQKLIDMGYHIHYMVADATKTVVIEMIEGVWTAIDVTSKGFMTNFYLTDVTFNADGSVYTPGTMDETHNAIDTNNITEHGSGLERYNLINNNYNSIIDKSSARQLLKSLIYTNAYKTSTNPYWCSEFVGINNLELDTPEEDYAETKEAAAERFANRTRDPEQAEYGTWQTSHSSVYDITNQKLYLCVQEDNIHEFEFILSPSIDKLIQKIASLEDVINSYDLIRQYFTANPDEIVSNDELTDILDETALTNEDLENIINQVKTDK